MNILRHILISIILMVVMCSSEKESYENDSAYVYSFGYKKFEECETVDFTSISYDEVYYRVFGDQNEYRIVLSENDDCWKIPETNQYSFYVYTEDGEMLSITGLVGVFRSHPVEEQEDVKGIILL